MNDILEFILGVICMLIGLWCIITVFINPNSLTEWFKLGCIVIVGLDAIIVGSGHMTKIDWN